VRRGTPRRRRPLPEGLWKIRVGWISRAIAVELALAESSFAVGLNSEINRILATKAKK
jgi:hypothetical protein